MRGNFAQLFWGLLLVLLDFKLNGFDLLVDGVGYLLIAAGCSGLSSLSPRFPKARTLCFALAILWLLSFVVPHKLTIAFGLVMTLLNVAFIWQLLGGIAEFALDRQRPDFAEQANTRRVAYVAISISIWLLTMVMHRSSASAPLSVAYFFAMLLVLGMILHLIHRVKVELIA